MADAVLQSPRNPHFFQLSSSLHWLTHEHSCSLLLKACPRKKQIQDCKVEIRCFRCELGSGNRWLEINHLRIGNVLVFRHEGELMFHVTALGSSCCEVEYTTVEDCDDHKDTVLASRIKPMTKN